MRTRRFLAWVVALLFVPFVCFWLLGPPSTTAAPPPDAAPVEHLAFWEFFIAVASAIWKGLEVAGRVALQALAWSVKALWAFAVTIYNGAKELGKFLFRAGKGVWQFTRWTYDHILKPAWEKFWRLVDRARAWLDKVFRPVFKFLWRVRTEILKFYDDYLRPVLDTIDLIRSFLRALAALHLDIARELDRKLAQLEARVTAPFDWLLAKVNEITTWVNRIVTADGFFQRLTLIRSLDQYKRAWIAIWWRSQVKSLTEEEKARRRRPIELQPPAEVIGEIRRAIVADDGPLATKAAEWVRDFELLLSRTPRG